MKRFTFVHIPRTAGNSIVRALGIKYDSHETAMQRRSQLKNQWDTYFNFTIIRNPWDRILSWYLFCKQLRKITAKERALYAMPFEEWITNGMHTHWETSNVKFNGKNPLTLHEYILDKNEIIVDFIGRFERLHQDFSTICKKIGIPLKHLPHIYKTRQATDDYRNYYNTTTKNIIAKIFEKDIELFKYTF